MRQSSYEDNARKGEEFSDRCVTAKCGTVYLFCIRFEIMKRWDYESLIIFGEKY